MSSKRPNKSKSLVCVVSSQFPVLKTVSHFCGWRFNGFSSKTWNSCVSRCGLTEEATMAGKQSEEFQKKFQTEAEKYAGLNKKLNKLVTQSQTLETQLNENQMVKDELDITREDARVFKLVGPVMVPQTVDDAKSNVSRRIEYIKAELKRNSDQVETVTKEVTAQRELLSGLEMQARQMAAAGISVS